MPPYRRRNPVEESRAALFEEAPPPRFFGNVGQGSTSFGSYISPRLALNLNREADAYEDERDDRATRQDSNLLRRAQSRSGVRLLPYMEAASKTNAELNKQRAESDLRLNPFEEERTEADAKLRTAQSQRALTALPEDEAARTEMRDLQLEDARVRDPYLNDFKTPGHRRAYKHYLKSLPKEDAYDKALELADDQGAVDAVYEAYANGDFDEAALRGFVEPVDSPDGQHFGMRVKPEARDRVRTMLADSHLRKLRLQQQREDRIAQSAATAQLLRALNDEADDLTKQLALDSGNAALKSALEQVKKDRQDIKMSLMGKDKPPAPSTGKPTDDSARSKLLR